MVNVFRMGEQFTFYITEFINNHPDEGMKERQLDPEWVVAKNMEEACLKWIKSKKDFDHRDLGGGVIEISEHDPEIVERGTTYKSLVVNRIEIEGAPVLGENVAKDREFLEGLEKRLE